ncbi:MAG: phosphoribosylaminoimidazolesuccinocarboxamide synthase [Microbacteriaceae bacterium]|nr:phosphoribosylaminoimidazolesuccinocarboxamide synthase [Microbacteriaceae bacterium]
MSLADWTHTYSGKVRDLYERADLPGRVLLVASDRVSAFDHVLDPAIPGKGALLTRLSRWWFARFADVPNHLVADESPIPSEVRDRSMLVRTLDMHPVECVVRGYLSGSGWKEYRASGTVCGIALPGGLADGDRLPEPVFTPAWKAPQGSHDENISFDRVVELVGADVAEQLREASLSIFARASAIAEARGVILADTKFEFGASDEHAVVLADEVLTSDSSRYWDKAAYDAGRRGVSWDKQGVRDWLAARWDGTGTPPRLDEEIVAATAARYAELIERLTA